MKTIIQHYADTGNIDMSLPFFESFEHFHRTSENLTFIQAMILRSLISDGMEPYSACFLASRFEPLTPDDMGEYSELYWAVQELIFWYHQPEVLHFWSDYNTEHKKKYPIKK